MRRVETFEPHREVTRMRRVQDLLRDWERSAAAPLTAREYAVRLPIHDAARLAALAQMYPGRTMTQLISDLIACALDEVEQALPYQHGERIIAEDESGDPIYEDVGPTPRFLQLTREHARMLAQELGITELAEVQEPAAGS
jgi:predicted DNA-binding protein